jgi:hypothetical protein
MIYLLIIFAVSFFIGVMFSPIILDIYYDFKDESQYNKKDKKNIKACITNKYKETDDVLLFSEPKKLKDIINSFKSYLNENGNKSLGNLWYIVFITQHSDKDQEINIDGINKTTFDLIKK